MGEKLRFGCDACDAEVWSFVEKFERCELELAEFDHADHLAVGMAYLSAAGFAEALARMRTSLQRFSAHHGKPYQETYHETITRFWLMKLAEVSGPSLWERVNRAVETLGNKDLIFDFYDRETLMSAAARNQWVFPQRLKPIPVPARRHD